MPDNKITVVATKEQATITLEYNGKTYKRMTVSTPTGAKEAGCFFGNEPEIPDKLVEELQGFWAYNLMRALQKT